jgi:hypothetical protein
VAYGYSGLTGINAEDLRVVEELLTSTPGVVGAAFHAVRSWRDVDTRTVIELLKRADLHADAELADAMVMGMVGFRQAILDDLTVEDVEKLLLSIEPIPRLEGHWIDEFMAALSRQFPHQVAEFFISRVERAAAAESFEFRAANNGPWSRCRLRFLETEEGLAVLRRVWAWLVANQQRGIHFWHAANDMFEAMFLHSLDVVVQLFEREIPSAPAGKLRSIASLFRQAHHSFVFTRSDFVVRFLERCAEVDPDLAARAGRDFFSSAISGVRSGVLGEAAPQDVERLRKAKEVLARLSLASPAYDLYDGIREAAERDIAQSRADGEALSDE